MVDALVRGVSWLLLAGVLGGALGCDAIKERLGQREQAQAEPADEPETEEEAPKKKKKKKKKKAADPSPAASAAPGMLAPPPVPLPPAIAQPALPAATVHYFADATSLPGLFKAQVEGPAHALELVVYPTYAKCQLVDPKIPDQADEYFVRNGALESKRPIKFTGKRPTKESLAQVGFALGEVDFKLIPTLIKDAKERLKLEDPKVSHIIIQRFLPFSSDVRFRVYVNSVRRNGSVEYDIKGKMTKVFD